MPEMLLSVVDFPAPLAPVVPLDPQRGKTDNKANHSRRRAPDEHREGKAYREG